MNRHQEAAMHVLVTEAQFGDADPLAERLRQIGCRVSRCHNSAGICQALAPGGRCPLDGADPIDLVVDVRPPVSDLTAREFGAICGIRARIPVAATGVNGTRPHLPPGLDLRVVATTEHDLIDSCQETVHREPHLVRGLE
jgi:hypothetical protein